MSGGVLAEHLHPGDVIEVQGELREITGLSLPDWRRVCVEWAGGSALGVFTVSRDIRVTRVARAGQHLTSAERAEFMADIRSRRDAGGPWYRDDLRVLLAVADDLLGAAA